MKKYSIFCDICGKEITYKDSWLDIDINYRGPEHPDMNYIPLTRDVHVDCWIKTWGKTQ